MDEWEIKETKKNCHEIKCPETEKIRKTLRIEKKAENQIKTLLNKYPNLEWMAAIKGKTQNETSTIKEIKIFEQKVTGATVELTDKGNEDMNKEPEVIGWIHSHNNMGVFTSGTDLSTANWNKITLVVNNKGEMIAKEQTKLPCGNNALTEMKIELETNEKDEQIEKEAEQLIKEKTYKPTNYYQTKTTIKEGGKGETCSLCDMIIKKNKHAIEDDEFGWVHRRCLQEIALNINKAKDGYIYYDEDQEIWRPQYQEMYD